MMSLYDRLGDLDAITAVVDAFVARAGGDDRINQKFARTDLPRLKKEFIDELCEAIVEVKSPQTATPPPGSYQPRRL